MTVQLLIRLTAAMAKDMLYLCLQTENLLKEVMKMLLFQSFIFHSI